MAYTPGDAANYDQDRFTADTVSEEARNDSQLEAQRKAEAESAQLQDARFIGYSEVLNVYAMRSDVEHLADRRARHLAANPVEQGFTREAGYDGAKQPLDPADGIQTTRADGATPADWADDYRDGVGDVPDAP